MVPEEAADRRARLGVRAVGEDVVVAERLGAADGAEPARDVHLLRDDVLPQRVDGTAERRIVEQHGGVGHARVQVRRADRVAHGFGLLRDRLVILAVEEIVVHPERIAGRKHVQRRVVLAAALIEEELRLVQVLAIAGRARQLHEGELDFLVPGDVVPAGRSERATDEVGALDRDVEQRALAGRLEVRDRRLVQMALVVQLVAGVQPRPAFRSRARRRMRRIRGPRGVQISVGLLRRGDDRDQIVELLVERRVGGGDQRVRRGLDDLVDVGVVVPVALVRPVKRVRRLAEIVDAPGLVVLRKDVRDRDAAVHVHLRAPEAAGDLDRGQGNRGDGVGARRFLRFQDCRMAEWQEGKERKEREPSDPFLPAILQSRPPANALLL